MYILAVSYCMGIEGIDLQFIASKQVQVGFMGIVLLCTLMRHDFDLLDKIIRHKFKDSVGSKHVSVGNYELCKSNRRYDTITSTSQLVPGTAITMAIIVTGPTGIEHLARAIEVQFQCPLPNCWSLEARRCPIGGGWVW